MTSKFSPFLCGFRKNQNSQYSLLKMIEVWKKNLDKRNDSLLLAKLEAYDFSMVSLKLMQSYSCNRFQRASLNTSFSDWKEIKTGFPQGSILGPFPFSISLNDILCFINNGYPCNYADDNTFYSIVKNLNMIKENLKINFLIMQKWFYEKHMLLNTGKFRY